MNLTDNQIIYRQYLGSRVWKAKRIQALEHYGCKCSRCGQFGSDVHHKTYERVGGNERMEDLEIMCRECHEAHHRVERATNPRCNKRRKNPAISLVGLARYLTQTQKEILAKKYSVHFGGLYWIIVQNTNQALIADALAMVGKKFGYRARRPASNQAPKFSYSLRKHATKLM